MKALKKEREDNNQKRWHAFMLVRVAHYVVQVWIDCWDNEIYQTTLKGKFKNFFMQNYNLNISRNRLPISVYFQKYNNNSQR